MLKHTTIMKKQTYTILELPKLVNETLTDVQAYLKKKYPNQLATIPTLQEWKKIAPKCDKWIEFYFFGSAYEYADGHWSVPCFIWEDGEWRRNARWLQSTWGGRYRVVLLGIDSGSDSVASESDSHDLALKNSIDMVKKEGYVIYKPI